MLLLFGGTGLLLAGLGVPLARRRVPPNHLYGLRVPATLNNEAVWYEANARTGRDLIVAGASIAAVAMAVFAVAASETTSAFVNTGYLVTATVVVCIRGLMTAKSLAGRP